VRVCQDVRRMLDRIRALGLVAPCCAAMAPPTQTVPASGAGDPLSSGGRRNPPQRHRAGRQSATRRSLRSGHEAPDSTPTHRWRLHRLRCSRRAPRADPTDGAKSTASCSRQVALRRPRAV
jgi:hypothetical protein